MPPDGNWEKQKLTPSETCATSLPDKNGNRDQNSKQTQWHRGARRSFNMLFGDAHAELFTFPNQVKDGVSGPAPDLNYLWW